MPHLKAMASVFPPAKRMAIAQPPRSTSATKAVFAASPNKGKLDMLKSALSANL
jgi:hypothetical protein